MTEIILGVDPGSRRTGFGLVSVSGDDIRHVDHGVIHLKESWSLPERLARLQQELHKLYGQFTVSATVVERIFFGKNADSAFKLGHARGVCLMVAAQNQSLVEEYAARFVKKSVTGSGAASKEHVQMVVLNILRVPPQPLAHDASDALALAITHARVRDSNARVKRALEGQL